MAACSDLGTADAAYALRYRAADARFALYAAFYLGDKFGVCLGAQHVGKALEIDIHFAARGGFALFGHKLRSVNSRDLIFAAPVMVADARRADEKLAKLAER